MISNKLKIILITICIYLEVYILMLIKLNLKHKINYSFASIQKFIIFGFVTTTLSIIITSILMSIVVLVYSIYENKKKIVYKRKGFYEI